MAEIMMNSGYCLYPYKDSQFIARQVFTMDVNNKDYDCSFIVLEWKSMDCKIICR